MNLFGLLAIPVLIFLNALFVAVEYGLVSVRKTRVEELVQERMRSLTGGLPLPPGFKL